MGDIPKTGLEMQIDQEAKELANVPKEPIYKFRGMHSRCHICGQVKNADEMKPYDTHIRGTVRQACKACHPQRGQHG